MRLAIGRGMKIRIKRNNQIFGPYSLEEIRSFLACGRLDYTEFAHLEGATEWMPITSLPGLYAPELLPSPPAPPEKSFRPGAVLRDVAILWCLTGIGGFIVGAASGPEGYGSIATGLTERAQIAIGLSNLLLCTVGYAISGCLARGNRWQHLCYVTLGVWFSSLINVLFFGVTLAEFIWMLPLLGMTMVLGGGISFLFKG